MNTDIGVLPKPIPFGKYCLLEKISVGGMAEVFKAKAFGAEGFERLLAVKRILNSIAEDETFISMFIDEAKIAGQLNHPNIAQIFDLGKVDGSYFIALEYVSGKDLRTIWERMVRDGAKPDIFMATHVAMKVCAALHYAHTKADASGNPLHIVHRDVSPHNVLLSYEGDTKIIDFGIAKAQGKTSETQVGILKGKFSYMSPEQVRGLHVDHRADIFSLGIVLYEMLTLERLFLGESDFDTLEKIRKVEMAPPTLYNPHIPRELEDIVLKSLAKAADDRFQSASEMYDALDRFMRNQGSYFQSKELASVMKGLFAAEIEMERKKLDHYRTISLDSLKQQQQQSNNGFLRWDEEELDTQVFGRDGKPIAGAGVISPALDSDEPLPDIVYKDAPPATAELLDVVELAAGFDDLDDPTMEFDRDEHLSALTGGGLDDPAPPIPPEPSLDPSPPTPTPAPAPPPPAAPSGPDLFGSSTPTARPTAIKPPPPAPKRNGLVIGLLVALILLLLGGIVAVLTVPSMLAPDDSAITFKVSNVDQVTIAIDDKVVHEGPATQDIIVDKVGPGSRSITISADGFATLTDSLKVEAGQKYVLPIQLEKKAAAASASGISVKVTHADASVFVDGKPISDPPPFEHNLSPGTYQVKFTKAGFLDEVRDVTVKDGEVARVDVTLRPSQVALNVRAEPQTAMITVLELDKPGEKTGRKVQSGKGTLEVSGLDATRSFRIVAEAPGHEPYAEEFTPGSEPSTSIVAKLTSSKEDEPVVADNTRDTTSRPGETNDNLLAKREEARKKREEARKRREEEERKAAAARKAEEDRKRREEARKDTTPPAEKPPEKTGPGFLNVASKPAAQVMIDGASVGWTPVINHKVSPGPHSVVLVNDKEGIRKTYRVTIKSGQSRSLINLPKK
ncbi:MAG: hypothetical protein CMH57_06695 [Myxococcales bacterium]|nr:hypothetical protein [Myxococcales bacterium]